MKKRKLKLKKGVKKALIILSSVIILLLINILMINKITKDFEKCDTLKGSTCSMYDLRDFYYKGGLINE